MYVIERERKYVCVCARVCEREPAVVHPPTNPACVCVRFCVCVRVLLHVGVCERACAGKCVCD